MMKYTQKKENMNSNEILKALVLSPNMKPAQHIVHNFAIASAQSEVRTLKGVAVERSLPKDVMQWNRQVEIRQDEKVKARLLREHLQTSKNKSTP